MEHQFLFMICTHRKFSGKSTTCPKNQRLQVLTHTHSMAVQGPQLSQLHPTTELPVLRQDYLGKWNSELLGTGPSWGWGAGAVTGRGGIPEFVVEDARVKRVDVVPPDSCAPGFVIEEAETATDITHDSSFIRFTVMERS